VKEEEDLALLSLLPELLLSSGESCWLGPPAPSLGLLGSLGKKIFSNEGSAEGFKGGGNLDDEPEAELFLTIAVTGITMSSFS
jgi:hypothetical protein